LLFQVQWSQDGGYLGGAMNEPTPLHRLFGLSWIYFFHDTGVEVEMEMDLSLKKQFLDLVIIRKGLVQILRPLPDGFDDLGTYNLLTFKSYQEALDAWALCELIGHYVNCRKQFSASRDDLLSEGDFRLFAVCARYPQKLAQQVEMTGLRAGVFEVRALGRAIRVIVVSDLPQEEHNAMLHLFSARQELLRYGKEHYRPRSTETSTLLYQLFKAYSEDPAMSEKLKEFVRQSIDELLRELPAEERLKGLPAEERLKGLPAEERLKGLSAEEVAGALPPEVLAALARKLKANGSASKPQ
jgi:hypothetical protein